jgi:hypothetical protein
VSAFCGLSGLWANEVEVVGSMNRRGVRIRLSRSLMTERDRR